MAITKIKMPLEYWLNERASSLSTALITESLLMLSLQKIQESKLVSKTYKQTLNFIDNKSYRSSSRKFLKMLVSKVEKDIPYLLTANLIEPYIHVGSGTSKITINLIRDPAVLRYLKKMNKVLRDANVPLGFSVPYDSTILTMKVDLKIATASMSRHDGVELVNHRKMYIALFYIEQLLQMFKTLHRKALYADRPAELRVSAKHI